MRGVVRECAACLAVLGCAAALAGCRRSAGDGPDIGPEDVRIELGTSGLIRNEAWSLLRLRLRNQGDDLRGEVEARGRSEHMDDAVTYRQELEVPARSATWREVTLPVQCAGWTHLTLTLRQPGFERQLVQELPEPARSDALCILAVGDLWPAYATLVQHLEEGVSRGLPAGIQPRPVKPVTVQTRHLPSRDVDYDAFQLVLLVGPDLAAAPEGAVEALTAWVERGGTLVAFPGPSWPGSSGAALERLLGVRVGAPGAAPPSALQRRLGPRLRRFAYHPVEPVDAARAIVDDIVCRARVGLGLAATFPVAPTEPAADLFAEPALLRAMEPVLERAVSFAGDAATGLRQVEKHVAPALFSQCGRRLPSRGVVCLSLALYGLLGFVLPWTLLGRRGRRELAFLTLIGAALVAIGCIYSMGVFSSLAAIEVDEVTVVRGLPGEKRAQATSFLGVISPRPQRVDLAGEAREALRAFGQRLLWRPLRGTRLGFGTEGEPLPVPATAIAARLDGAAEVEPFGLFPNAMRFLRCDFETSIESGIRVETVGSSTGNGFRLVVRNAGSERATVHWIQGQQHARLGTVEPGASFELPVRRPAETQEVQADPLESLPWRRSSDDADGESEALASLLPLLLRRVVEPSRVLPPGVQWNVGPNGPTGQVVGTTQAGEALKNPWAASEPRYLIVVTAAPTFPALASIARRRALTAVVFELPPRSEDSR